MCVGDVAQEDCSLVVGKDRLVGKKSVVVCCRRRLEQRKVVGAALWMLLSSKKEKWFATALCRRSAVRMSFLCQYPNSSHSVLSLNIRC
jgi:hypothetical protein